MCSTFKLLLVGAVLQKIERHEEELDRFVRYTKADLLEYAPVARRELSKGGMSVKDLCAAAMMQSDNTATNLLISSVGGPRSVTVFARSIGDTITRLDRIEPIMSKAQPGDLRDTSTPTAMLEALRKLILGKVLSTESRRMLADWLIGNTTGDQRLRAGLPHDWKVGDKTGSGDHGTTNDLAIAWPPIRSPVFISVYLTGSTQSNEKRNATIAAVGRLIADAILRPGPSRGRPSRVRMEA